MLYGSPLHLVQWGQGWNDILYLRLGKWGNRPITKPNQITVNRASSTTAAQKRKITSFHDFSWISHKIACDTAVGDICFVVFENDQLWRFNWKNSHPKRCVYACGWTFWPVYLNAQRKRLGEKADFGCDVCDSRMKFIACCGLDRKCVLSFFFFFGGNAEKPSGFSINFMPICLPPSTSNDDSEKNKIGVLRTTSLFEWIPNIHV